MGLNETETLSWAITLIATMAAVGWLLLGLPLRISPAAALRFGVANLLLVSANLFAAFRNTNVDAFEYYRNINLTHILVLGSAIFFRAGMRRLYSLPCPTARDLTVLVAMTLVLMYLAPYLGVGASNLVAAGCVLATGYFCLRAGHEGFCSLQNNFTPLVRFAVMWPFGIAGMLFLARAAGLIYSEMVSATVENGEHIEHLNEWLWAQMAVLIIINSSLVGMTVGALIGKVKEQADRLQKILDTAPVGVAVASGGVIRFANPRVMELLDMKVGDAAPRALVNPSDRYRIIEALKEEGSARNLEIQMYCPKRTIRDLMVSYLPTEYEGQEGVLGWIVDITQRKKNEKRLAFNRTVVENSTPMFWVDPKTVKVVYANKAGLALMELTSEEVIGMPVPKHLMRLLPQESMEGLLDKLRDAGRPLRFETRHVRANGSFVDIDVSSYVAEDDERTLLIASMLDITEQKAAEHALRQAIDEQTAIFESATLGIAFIKDWTIVRANHRLEELFGWLPGELIGKSPRVWYPDAMKLAEGPYADIRRGEIHFGTHRLARKDSSMFWCRVSGSAIDNSDLSRGTVWMFDDVTKERQAAELMREAKEIAEEATRMKSDFLANMSHEIRTPMNAIIGMSHLALQTDLNPKQRNYIEKVEGASRNLLGIINDILDFSKIEAGKMQFEKADFHLEDVMENLADLSTIKAQDKGLELLFDIGSDVPTALNGDALRLGQVLTNLVGNAIKFTERGEVTVGIHVVDREPISGDAPAVRLRFDISDTGVGLTEDQRGKLFSAFAQADASTTRKYGGTGLGLTISKRLVEMMDGEIGVDSQAGVGSTFHFTARFGLQPEQRVLAAHDDDVGNLRILVVDDNARAREILSTMLTSLKFESTTVASGTEAIRALEDACAENRPYGLVLMDWVMPELDGLETIQRIRTDPRIQGTTAFVMVTAYSRDELMERAQGTVVNGLLLKPVSPSTLLDSILTALGKEVGQHRRKHQRQANSRVAEEKLRGARLLLVEDNLVNQELALEILNNAGIQVDVANNGEEALERVGGHDYDGVLMDCQMPVMDGFEATRRMRADSRFATLPILAMTANAMSGDREKCIEAGMNDHIGKPIDVAELFMTLARWVKPARPVTTLVTGGVATDDDALPEIQGLDVQAALHRLEGNRKLLRKLIQRFGETQRDVVARIREAALQGNRDTAAREAHTLKGLAGNIGAVQLATLAGVLESLFKHGEEDFAAALGDVESALSLLLGGIASVFIDHGGTEAAVLGSGAEGEDAIDMQALAEELRRLADLLQDDDSRASRHIDSISGMLGAAGQRGAATQIRKLIGRYDFEGAMERLQEAAEALDISLQ